MASFSYRENSGVTGNAQRVGIELQDARQRLGLELSDIADRLRIRVAHLRAIEEGRIGDLPAGAYAVGFTRAYATALGLDANDLTRRFRAEVADVNRKTELEFPVPLPERGIPAGAVVALGVILAIGAYVGWYRLSADAPPPSDAVPAVPERLAPLAERSAPIPSSPSTPAKEAPGPAFSYEPPQGGPAVPPSQAAAASAVPPAPQVIPPTGEAPPPVTAPSPPPANGEGRIVLRAKSDSWMQVREPKGAVLLNRVLHAGETWPVPSKPNLVLTTGNAGGTEVLVDGVLAPALGTGATIRRSIALDADQLKAAKDSSGATPAAAQAPGVSGAKGPSPPANE
jgi:cytoskeleton protein RodZ